MAALLAAVVAITIANVVTRYLGFGTFTWTDESARRILVWMTFVGGALAVAKASHLRIDSLVTEATGRMARVLPLVVGAISVAFFLLLVIGGGQFTLDTMDRVTPGMRVSTAWTSLSGPVGGLLFLLSFVGRLGFGPPPSVVGPPTDDSRPEVGV